MKKLLTVIISTMAISSCGFWQDKKEDEKKVELRNSKNVYVIDTPYGMEGLYDEMTIPEVYSIVATRATNKMLDSTRNIYETARKDVRLYINTPKKASADISNGYYLAQDTTRKIIEGSRNYSVVNNIKDADYYLETLISKIEIQGQDTPTIQYKLMMFDKTDKKVGEWIELIRKTKNGDRSWL